MVIVLVDEHPVTLLGLRKLIKDNLQVERLVDFHSPAKANREVNWATVDVVFTALEFSEGKNGVDFIQELRSNNKNIKIICYTAYKTLSVISQMKKCGANAFVSKDASVEDLLDTVSDVLRCSADSFCESAIYKLLLRAGKTIELKVFNSYMERNLSLTPTEKLVCKHIVDNYKTENQVLAKALNIELNTLKKHITSIYKKLGVRSKEGVLLVMENLACTV